MITKENDLHYSVYREESFTLITPMVADFGISEIIVHFYKYNNDVFVTIDLAVYKGDSSTRFKTKRRDETVFQNLSISGPLRDIANSIFVKNPKYIKNIPSKTLQNEIRNMDMYLNGREDRS